MSFDGYDASCEQLLTKVHVLKHVETLNDGEPPSATRPAFPLNPRAEDRHQTAPRPRHGESLHSCRDGSVWQRRGTDPGNRLVCQALWLEDSFHAHDMSVERILTGRTPSCGLPAS